MEWNKVLILSLHVKLQSISIQIILNLSIKLRKVWMPSKMLSKSLKPLTLQLSEHQLANICWQKGSQKKQISKLFWMVMELINAKWDIFIFTLLLTRKRQSRIEIDLLKRFIFMMDWELIEISLILVYRQEFHF